MTGASIPAALELLVAERACRKCEYCLLHEADAILPHEVDHIIARQHRGETDEANLAFSCWDCNRTKGPNIASVDPSTGEIVRLFHPRRDQWADHFRLEASRIVGLTPSGRATVFVLELNSPERIRTRAHLEAIRRFPS